jgi:signal transduction histidine kinase
LLVPIVLLALLLLGPWASGATPGDVRTVVVLTPDNTAGAPGSIQLNQNLRATFAAHSHEQIQIRFEPLDITRFQDSKGRDLLVDFLQKKYADQAIDLVVAGLAPSLDFALRYRGKIFPGVPIVFVGLDEEEVRQRTLPPDVIGVPIKMDLTGTLELALRLQPETRRVFVIVGSSSFDARWEAVARRLFRAYEGKLEFVYLSRGSMDDLLKRVSNLPDRSIVQYLHIFQDGAGQTFIPAEALKLIAGRANAPIYSHVGSYVGSGIVGGHVMSFELAGKNAANLGLRILAGERPEAISRPDVSSNQYVVDWRQLRRWGIRERGLPRGTDIRYREPGIWDLYQWQIIGAITVIGLQAVLLIGLLVQTGRRKKIEATLRDRLSFETLVSGLSAMFARLHGPEVDRGIEESLRRVAEHLEVDHATIMERVPGGDAIKALYTWQRPGAPSALLSMRRDDVPWAEERLRNGELFRFSRLSDLPAEASVDHETFARVGITSGVGLPLIAGGATVGALTLSHLGRERQWHDDVVQRLQFVAGIFSSALVRRHNEVELEKLRHDLSHFGRVAAMTELTASLAHELSQPLTAILANAQAARRMLDRDVEDNKEELREILADIVADDQRANEVIRHARAFVKNDGTYRSPVDINAVVRDVVSFVRSDAMARKVSMQIDLDPGLPMVIADRVQLQQVLVNLLMNAFDAVSSAGERRTTVITRKAGTAIEVSVRDSGRGIPAADLERIFDRFYTTKSSGLGMGLSIARSLIETHGGRLWAANNPDGGATLTFTVPVPEQR